jgi:hypothetical protein
MAAKTATPASSTAQHKPNAPQDALLPMAYPKPSDPRQHELREIRRKLMA